MHPLGKVKNPYFQAKKEFFVSLRARVREDDRVSVRFLTKKGFLSGRTPPFLDQKRIFPKD
jgi:hypothetical protein